MVGAYGTDRRRQGQRSSCFLRSTWSLLSADHISSGFRFDPFHHCLLIETETWTQYHWEANISINLPLAWINTRLNYIRSKSYRYRAIVLGFPPSYSQYMVPSIINSFTTYFFCSRSEQPSLADRTDLGWRHLEPHTSMKLHNLWATKLSVSSSFSIHLWCLLTRTDRVDFLTGLLLNWISNQNIGSEKAGGVLKSFDFLYFKTEKVFHGSVISALLESTYFPQFLCCSQLLRFTNRFYLCWTVLPKQVTSEI